MNDHPGTVGAAGVGGLLGFAHLMHIVEPILADISYVVAIILAIVTLYQKFRPK